MLNKTIFMGRMARDPELRYTSSGIAAASFSLAVDRDFADKQTGEREADFIDCVAWRGVAEFAARYFKKGQLAVVSGRLQIRPWTDKAGNKRRSAEILVEDIYFAGAKKDAQNAAQVPAEAPETPEPGNSLVEAKNAAEALTEAPAAESEMSAGGELPF